VFYRLFALLVDGKGVCNAVTRSAPYTPVLFAASRRIENACVVDDFHGISVLVCSCMV